MCWINIKNQLPPEGDIIDVWVQRSTYGFRCCNMVRQGDDFYFVHPITSELTSKLITDQQDVSHWRPAPPPPSIHDR